MRKIYTYLKTFATREVKLPYILAITAFLTLSIFLNYHYHVSSNMIGKYRGTLNHFFINIVFYSLPVFFSVLAYIYFYKRKDLIKNASFWFVLFYIICSFAFRTYFYQYTDWATAMNNGVPDNFLIRSSSQIFRALFVFLVVYIYWKFSGHSKETVFYGFRLKGVEVKPYLFMLLLMFPLIAIASTQPDFLRRYPTFAIFVGGITFNPVLIAKISIYEILYGSDYIAIELFFRGFVLYALSRFMGRGAIIPMATMYVFIHFGKPLGETISSFFGGMILGVIAYETNSIIGGIIVHCGIAYMMEIGGFLGNSM